MRRLEAFYNPLATASLNQTRNDPVVVEMREEEKQIEPEVINEQNEPNDMNEPTRELIIQDMIDIAMLVKYDSMD
jgi:hypothetical protein